ncbi:MAG: DUF1805 domain-containing protein [Candidatus Omnitrophica bacterium]|nr:DUF1805 domain-containing protein [Candidatus Omnitrophota bacterium]
MRIEKIKLKDKELEALEFSLGKKNLIVIKGSKGYIMCGYLNLNIANKFKDVAIKVVGVTRIEDVLNTKVYAISREAKKLGINKGESISDVLKIIA